jgi:acetyl-CoA carboxylase biotin carboxylase subunit
LRFHQKSTPNILQYEFSMPQSAVGRSPPLNAIAKGDRVHRVLIANRGEIALRAVRTCRRLGLESVAVYSAADANSPHRWAADHAIRIGPPPPKLSYLNAAALIEVASALKCDAVYPGYGFLAEDSAFAERCAQAGLTFIGPTPEVIARMGDKVSARQAAASLSIPIVPGSKDGFRSAGAARARADELGFPLLLKASAGGGGRGMRVVATPASFVQSFDQASAEAEAAFGRPDIYLERFFPQVRHIEIQVFGDRHGNYMQLGERDCSVQRRHQKLLEEAPSPVLDKKTRDVMADAALALVRAINYVNAGTVEFIYDVGTGRFYFIEMNTRIQVEHPVTEMVTGNDLVAEQFRVAAGERLSLMPAIDGGPAAIEFRINAEDAAHDFRPSPGMLKRWRPPSGKDIRLDSHVYENYVVPPYYDSMLGKLIVAGHDRAAAIERARTALEHFQVAGIATTLEFHADLVRQPEFTRAEVHTRWVEEKLQAVH